MADLSPQEIAAKQVKNARNAIGDFKKGVQNVKVNPMQAAARKIDKMRQGFIDAIDSGKVKAGFESVSQQDWIDATSGKGGDNWAKGIEGAQQKIIDFQTQIKPHRDNVKTRVNNMPNDTQEQRIDRMVANARGMAEFKFRKKAKS